MGRPTIAAAGAVPSHAERRDPIGRSSEVAVPETVPFEDVVLLLEWMEEDWPDVTELLEDCDD
jgi:hypothetical protein